jgi:hypothetical protein
MTEQDMGWITLTIFVVIIVAEFVAVFFRDPDDEPFDD